MNLIELLVQFNNRLQKLIGHTFAWLGLAVVLLVSLAVILRYGFNFSSSKLDELVVYLAAIFFMLGISYALQQNQHVRVDVFYERFSPKVQNIINFLGNLIFILPLSIFILWTGWDYVSASWIIKEKSMDASGLGYVYLLKSVILITALLILLQALTNLAEIGFKIKNFQGNN